MRAAAKDGLPWRPAQLAVPIAAASQRPPLLAVAAGSSPWFSGRRAPIPRRRTLPLPPRPGGDGADRSPPARGCAALRKSARRWREADARGVTWRTAAYPTAGSEMQGSVFFTKRRAGGVRVQSKLASQCCGAGGLGERPQCREAVRQALIACPALSRVSVGAALTLHPHPACPRQMGRIAARAALPCAAGPGGRGAGRVGGAKPARPPSPAAQHTKGQFSCTVHWDWARATRGCEGGGTLIASAGLSAHQ